MAIRFAARRPNDCGSDGERQKDQIHLDRRKVRGAKIEVKVQLQIAVAAILVAPPVYSANPFLDARDDKPVSANFRGAEWGEEIAQDEIALTARVITTRIARMPWGGIFKIGFSDVKSRAEKKREIQPEYFI